MINLVDTENYGKLKFTSNDIERFNDFYLVNASDYYGNVYSGVVDLNFNEVKINKYTLFNEIEKILVPYDIVVTKENINNITKYASYSLDNNNFIEIQKPSAYVINKVNNDCLNHKIKSLDIVKNKCIVMESNFYYYPIVKMMSYMEPYDTLTEVDELRESATLFNYFNKTYTSKKARVLKK